VVLRYRIFLEQKGYAPNTTNLRLAAVRRLAYEACDSGLLSPELGLGAGIRRVKGVRRLGVRVGNWLTPAQGKLLLERAVLFGNVARQIAGVVDHAPDLDHAFLAGASATRSMALLKTQK
jgi:hypothetical protein